MNSRETQVGFLFAVALFAIVLWRLLVEWFSKPAGPDPWDASVAESLVSDEVRPLCPHCHLPHQEWVWFCPHCDASVGALNNYSPYLYLFSFGEVLRTGTQSRFRVNWLTVSGYLLLAVGEYAVFAPVYWFLLLRNVRRQRRNPPPQDPAAGPPSVGAK